MLFRQIVVQVVEFRFSSIEKLNELEVALPNGAGRNPTKKMRLFHRIMPVQRIPRYVLLLSDMLKRTSSTHPDVKLLTTAIDVTQKLAQDINESNRKIDAVVSWHKIVQSVFNDYDLPDNSNRGLLEFLQTKNIKFSEAAHVKKSKDKDVLYHVYLLTDYVVVAKAQKGLFNKEQVKQVTCVHLVKGTSIKKVEPNGIDFGGMVTLDIESEEKLKIWFRLANELCA